MPEKFDAIIIGSGPNGLAAGIELARNGLEVLIIEANDEIGGGTMSGELTLPGFTHDYCSAVHPLAACSPYFQSLPLEEFGLKWMYPKYSVAHPLMGEPAVFQTQSLQDTSEHLGRDKKAWSKLFKPFIENGDTLLKDVLGPLKWPDGPIDFLKFGLSALRPATSLVKSKFEEGRTRALFAGSAAHSVMPLDFYFSSAIGLVLLGAGHIKTWPVPKYGANSISKSLAGYFQGLGGKIETGNRIKNFKELPSANAYVFDTDPHQLAAIAGSELPEGFRRKLLKFNMGPGIFKVDWALDGPIPWTDPECNMASTVHVGGTYEEIAESVRLMWNGKHSERPFLIVCQQSEIDPSRAPKGKHTGYAYCHVPHGSQKDMTNIIESQIERFAPGFKDIILERKSTSPQQLQAMNPNLIGGAITGGASNLGQLFARPTLRMDPYSTPNDKIFICSASTPPGGGVHGMCGYWAARSVLKRLGG